MRDLRSPLAARFAEVNGEHLMTPADDEYVGRHYVTVEEVSERADEVREHMLAGWLPLPGYLRSDGAEMVPADLLGLVEKAGGVAELPAWWAGQHWPSAEVAAEEWQGYITGQYVCLKSVTPQTIQLKRALVTGIGLALRDPRPECGQWLDGVHVLVDQLDAIEPPFTGCGSAGRCHGIGPSTLCGRSIRRKAGSQQAASTFSLDAVCGTEP
jgi:hypothetical protein